MMLVNFYYFFCSLYVSFVSFIYILHSFVFFFFFFFFSSRRRHTRFDCDWSSDVCSSDLRSFSRSPRLVPSIPPSRPRDETPARTRKCCSRRRSKSRRPSAGDWTTTSRDRKSTRLNSSHSQISYAVFCLKKKKKKKNKKKK